MRSRKRESGQSTAEFVVVFPFIILLFFLIIDFGWLLKNWIVVTNTAREEARCIAAVSCTENGVPTDPNQLAHDRIHAGLTTNVANIVANSYYIDQDKNGNPSAGDTVFVCIKADDLYITPLLTLLGTPNPIHLRAAEAMRLEYAVPASWVTPDPVTQKLWLTQRNGGGCEPWT